HDNSFLPPDSPSGGFFIYDVLYIILISKIASIHLTHLDFPCYGNPFNRAFFFCYSSKSLKKRKPSRHSHLYRELNLESLHQPNRNLIVYSV
ncbi:MAG: hypothetical protein RSA23_04295, partial [Carnobacterium sp.]